jgi:hypothetical protein
MFIVLPLEGAPWVGSTVAPQELPQMIEWAAARTEADPAYAELMTAALRFVRWSALADEEGE